MTSSIWPDFWIVRSNGGCQACDAIAGLHLKPPRRPHAHCQCTYTPFWAPSSPVNGQTRPCRYDKHLLLSLQTDGGDTEWNSDEGQYDVIEVDVDFMAMCKDGSIVTGSYTHHGDVESDRFPFSSMEDLETWSEMILDTAIRLWEDEADRLCPRCV